MSIVNENIPYHFFRRKAINGAMLALCAVSALIAIGILSLIFFYTINRGASYLSLDFFLQMPKPVGETGGGMANAIVGTVILIGIGSAIGLPIGVMAGIYLAEHGNNKFAVLVRFMTDVLSGVPSIVAGVVAYSLVVIPTKHFSAFAGGVALAILMIPTVTRTTEEMVRLVPQSYREAGLALGIPQWKTTVQIVLRTAFRGIVTGILLAVARVAGETAPLLFTALGNRFWSTSLDQPIASLSVFVYDYAKSPFEDWNNQAWAAALVLIILISLLSLSVRIVTRNRFSSR
ncbi:MAG: phosphate ABC transporter permease PstA [Ignavibacteriales bacterium]|nr:phosphate ABC transporter permease PstA [Ignavibacteriales bacterium]